MQRFCQSVNLIRSSAILFKGLTHFTPGNALMLLTDGGLIALAAIKEHEPAGILRTLS